MAVAGLGLVAPLFRVAGPSLRLGRYPDSPGFAGVRTEVDFGSHKGTEVTFGVSVSSWFRLKPLRTGEVARSSAALALALVPGGSGLSL